VRKGEVRDRVLRRYKTREVGSIVGVELKKDEEKNS